MSSFKEMNDKIGELSKTGKARIGTAIDDVADVASHAAEKGKKLAHDAGEKVKDAGEKILKLVD
jgi:hypothetical protein